MTAIRSSSDFTRRMESAENSLIVLDFYATWCGPCKDMDKTLKKVIGDYRRQAVFMKINVDSFDKIAEKYKVRSLPTFVFIKNKRQVARFTGADERKLWTIMAKHTETAD